MRRRVDVPSVRQSNPKVGNARVAGQRVTKARHLVDEQVADRSVVTDPRRVGRDQEVDREVEVIDFADEPVAALLPVSAVDQRLDEARAREHLGLESDVGVAGLPQREVEVVPGGVDADHVRADDPVLGAGRRGQLRHVSHGEKRAILGAGGRRDDEPVSHDRHRWRTRA